MGTRSSPTFASDSGLPCGSGNQSVPNGLLAREFAPPANRFRFLSRCFVRRLLIEALAAHLPEHAFALHFLLKDTKRLIDVVVSNEYLHGYAPKVVGMVRRRAFAHQ